MTPTIITLAALNAPLPSVDLGAAGVHAVQHISGAAMQLVHAARQESDALQLWEAAALCLPTASREAVFDLSVTQVQAVISIASGAAEAVLEAVGNASVPATGDAPAPAP